MWYAPVRWMLVFFDFLWYLAVCGLVLGLYPGTIDGLTPMAALLNLTLGFFCIFSLRILLGGYRFILRYAGASEYIHLILIDSIGAVVFLSARKLLPYVIIFPRALSLVTLNLLGALMMRLIYQYIYQMRSRRNIFERVALKLLRFWAGVDFGEEQVLVAERKIKIAIIGAGSIGAVLAEELLRNPRSVYYPACFVDVDREKVRRSICGITVLDAQSEAVDEKLALYGVQEVVFALPNATAERKKVLYDLYRSWGYKIKVYDYSFTKSAPEGRRQLRDFNIEELLFRRVTDFTNEKTASWYKGKTILITGGGGSIGSELARQIAKVSPKRLVILDIYENGAYDIQQELKIRYGAGLDLVVEIADVGERSEMEKVFATHRPDIVLHAAAHKHVPLMERNCCEAVRNNVFGTLNVVEVCEKYGVSRFIMISTDKAVNPTNVMGATKRMCEMIVQSRSGAVTSFSTTRFGNVLGSNGSVIPLFRRQIARGGPVTITDKRIIRYFMTIPEASQLVMTSGAMAANGELYVLDMGKPVRILDLAENMIRLSGFEPYKDIQIVVTGLRPGEKLYEELLVKTEELDKTENNMIFVERDKPLSEEEIAEKLNILSAALATEDDKAIREALMRVVPTFRRPEEVNEESVQR